MRRVRQLIDEGKLEARQVGRDYVIATSSLEGVKVYGKAGRPPNTPATGDKRATGRIRGSNEASTSKKRGGKK
jgi:hypothetical protein